MPLLIFIYYMMGLLICEYENFWPEVSIESLTLRWPLRPVGLLLENFSWYKAGKFYEDYKYLYAIMLKGWWSAVMDDPACRAQQGRGMQTERTPPMDDIADGSTTRIHWRIKAAMSSELRISYIICVTCLIKMEYFSAQKFQNLGTAGIQLEGRRHKRSTPRTRIQWRMTQPTEHTKDLLQGYAAYDKKVTIRFQTVFIRLLSTVLCQCIDQTYLVYISNDDQLL